MDENGLLTRMVVDGGHEFHDIDLPNVLVFQVLRTAHDDLGHNRFPRMYAAVKRVSLLERHEGRYQKTLQNMCNLHATQARKCKV